MADKKCLAFYAADAHKWLSEQPDLPVETVLFESRSQAVSQACWQGRLEVLKWLQSQRGLFVALEDSKRKAVASAASNGRRNIFAWFLSRFPLNKPRDLRNVTHEAAWTGHLPILQLLHAHGALNANEKCTRDMLLGEMTVVELVSRYGHVDILTWLVDIGTPLEDKDGVWTFVDIAARYGRLEVLKWAHALGKLNSQNKDWYGNQSAQLAALDGRLDDLKWLHARGLLNARGRNNFGRNRGMTIAHIAARDGQLEMLQWLHELELFDASERDEPTGCTAALWAAQNRYANKKQCLAVLRWLHSIGKLNLRGEFDRNETSIALLLGFPDNATDSEILQWIHEED